MKLIFKILSEFFYLQSKAQYIQYPNRRLSRALCLHFRGLKTSRIVSSSSVSSPLRPVPVFLDSLSFLRVALRILAHKTSRSVLALSMFAPTPFNRLRIFSHASCFTFFVTVDENGAKTINLCSLTSWAKSNFCCLDNMLSDCLRIKMKAKEAKPHVLKGKQRFLIAYVKKSRITF